MIRKLLPSAVLLFMLLSPARACDRELLRVEDMTWVEVSEAIQTGKRSAIIFTGGTEQNGPQMVLGKHNRMAYSLAESIARELGDALVFPVIPFAPNGDVAARGGHMRFPGSVSLREQTFAALVEDVVRSAIAAGFTRILIMGDHGDGQDVLAAVARKLDAATSRSGVRVFHIREIYSEARGAHAGREDTSMLMAVDRSGCWVRKERMAGADAAAGVGSDPAGASVAQGRRLIDERLQAALKAIRQLETQAPAGGAASSGAAPP